eukprot:TRINITY_DN8024_c0_g1_i1.p1 TRINITY_DN8024_c0_g1~~TRINITY_DN8024_c0_g1_i1.p1  ORF type:complete len:412 (+),score=102.81 TRINITY_DN8024_c0_g1_i1:89-1324(+)
MIVVGILSGTSVDGIDIGIARFEHTYSLDNTPIFELEQLFAKTVEWSQKDRELIFALFADKTTTSQLCKANFVLGQSISNAVQSVINESGLKGKIDLIANHGQTVWHDVDENGKVSSTLQIGEDSVISAQTGVTVVGDFRVADVAVGGQGAPLVSIFDWYILRPKHTQKWRAVQNIGGISNVTFLPPQESTGQENNVIAFDEGPGNMMIDFAVSRITKGEKLFDKDGEIARRGKINSEVVEEILGEKYFSLVPPKTTGRELFGVQFSEVWFNKCKQRGLGDEDIVATFTEVTALSIARAYKNWTPGILGDVLVGGGGSYNKYLMERIAVCLEREIGYFVPVKTHEEAVKMDSGFKESLLFALLGYCTCFGIKGNIPSATGARKQVVLGKITPGDNFKNIALVLNSAPPVQH